MASTFPSHFVNDSSSAVASGGAQALSTATSGEYETSMQQASAAEAQPSSSMYQQQHDPLPHYPPSSMSSSSSSLPATLQGALQGALMSQREGATQRAGMHHHTNM